MISIRRYVFVKRYSVSLYTYQFCAHGESAHNIKRDRVSSATGEGAFRGVMRQSGVQFAHFARVIDLETNTCQLLENVCLDVC